MALTVPDLLAELQKLSREDKLRAMRFLADELALEENMPFLPGAQYEIWSPYDAAGAAEKLMAMLKADQDSS